ncbi:MAG: hypothetical protein A2W98_03925 [Bacteroidetes bacterium GWF2_33_38]|nr:MAG: hypothetical protein A2W98_03925 [Bacteroidetes bacterium GWF2_33_38]OFY76204.1 MAG: hypothetical protein A2265_10750 [Bacteroidetes bacterium RIFOXYA12_FULL_33_9]OFY92109.1 MAG: hypothetical protein A2236_07620 [Bacteroidetes bacterium RIFOXYA2_FULL_33_7]
MYTEGGNEKWLEQKEKLKKKYADLINDDLKFEEIIKDEFMEKLQTKLTKTKEDLDKIPGVI